MNASRSLSFRIAMIFILSLIPACASPQPATPAPAPEIEVRNISENEPVIVPIVQVKSYDQCVAATPLRTQIHFTESNVEAQQSELTLGARVGAEASVSAVAKVEIEGSIQQKFASVNTSSRGYQEVIDIEVPAHAHYRYTITWQETRKEGEIEYAENGQTKYAAYSYRIGLTLASSLVEEVPCPGSQATEVIQATEAPVDLPQPTPTSPPPVKTLADGCIFSGTWTVASSLGKPIPAEADGCYAPELPGMFASPGSGLRVLDDGNRSYVISGIYTPIRNDSTIEFKVFVKSMFIVDEALPVEVSFAVVSLEDPMDARNSARFKLHVERNQNSPVIFFIAGDRGDNTGVKVRDRHYEYGRTYTIRLALTGNVMNVFINGIPLDETLDLPEGPKAFYIGYQLPAFGGVDAQVQEVLIDGVPK